MEYSNQRMSRCRRFVLVLGLSLVGLVPPFASGASGDSVAAADSLRLVEFSALPKSEREDRAQQADHLREDAQDLSDGPRRRDLLAEATAIDPTDARTWLDLAEVQRWMGYPDRARASLATARFAAQGLKGDEKRDVLDRYCLDQAWLEYDEANWSAGEKYAKLAIKRKVGLSAQLIAGLNRAPRVRSEAEMRGSLQVFAPFERNTNRPANFEWVFRLWMHLQGIAWVPPDVWDYKEPRVKVAEHNLTRWRDFGLLFEVNGEGELAIRFYGKSAQDLPVRDGGWLREGAAEIPGARASLPPMPFWTNPDGGYVTGSLLAYETHAYRMMMESAEPAERTRWAELVVRAGNATVPHYPKRPWARLWRGEAYLALDKGREAEEDVAYAAAYFDELGIAEPHLNPVYGHILLMDKNYREALPVLEKAALDFPDDGSVWAELGVARVMVSGRDPAREAFDRAITLDPELAVAWRNRGLLNLKDGRFNEAVADLEKASRLVPGDEQTLAEWARARQLAAGH